MVDYQEIKIEMKVFVVKNKKNSLKSRSEYFALGEGLTLFVGIIFPMFSIFLDLYIFTFEDLI